MPAAFDWHTRFQQQVLWTKELRNFLYPLIHLRNSRRVLEVGCGTGALLSELSGSTRATIHGLDLNRGHLFQAREHAPHSRLVQGDALRLPYPDGAFDISLCHFLLLWVKDPAQAVREMKRVTRPGGYVLALAEPDYGGRMDYPLELGQLGQWQRDSLARQGADPGLGRRLAEIFHQAGFSPVHLGLLGGQWTLPQPPGSWQSEWATLEADLQLIPELWKPEQLERLKQLEIDSRQRGERLLYVPTFYAYSIA